MGSPADSPTLAALRLLRRDCVRAYTDALTEYKAIEEQLGDIRSHHRNGRELSASERELVNTLPDRGLRHGITLTRAAAALEQLDDAADPDPAATVGEVGEIGEELALMWRPVRLLADMYVLMIVATSAEDVFGLPYVDSQLLPEYA
jgi:hypothetical protein